MTEDVLFIRKIVKETHRQLGKLETHITQAEAYRRYGRRRVYNLRKQGYLKPVRDEEKTNMLYSVAELDEVMTRNNCLEKFKLKPKKK